jgi:hypothetical protein
MPDVSGPGGSTPAGLEREPVAAHRVGWGSISLYTWRS